MAIGLVQQAKNTVLASALAMVAVTAAGAAAQSNIRPGEPPLVPTPGVACTGADDRPETGLQGRVSREDHDSGRAAAGFACNAELVGSYRSEGVTPDTFGSIGGFKTLRYVDAAGNECAYFDSTLLFPTNAVDATVGVTVLDMADPANPVPTAQLVTPGMDQPHESLVLSQERGILAAVTGTLSTSVGILDIYDVSQDCRQPVLQSTSPMGVLGHESGLSPDGNTFWSASTATDYIFAVDISDPKLPQVIYVGDFGSHGITVSADGTRTYLANTGEGLIVLDTTEVQERVPNPTVTEVGRLDWTSRSIPQSAEPFTVDGHPYMMEIDEFGTLSEVGAARIIDLSDETAPFVVSNLRLEVHQPEHFDTIRDDPGATLPIQGYAGHYCALPSRVDPTIIACSMILSGLRVFDITDPAKPVEIAYFNAPVQPRPVFDSGITGGTFEASNWAMSAPAFVPERNEIWYTDAFQGFQVVRLAQWPTRDGAAPLPTPAPPPAPGALPVTGPVAWVTSLGALGMLGTSGLLLRRRRTS